MTDNTEETTIDNTEVDSVDSSTEDTDETDHGGDQPDEAETFPREYVEQLRNENARYRQRAQQADELAHRLHVELARATGRLADPTDLPFEEQVQRILSLVEIARGA